MVNVVAARLWTFDLPMSAPVHVARRALAGRTGALLGLLSDTSDWTFGEIAPLPGVHRESLGDCIAYLEGVLPRAIADSPSADQLLDALALPPDMTSLHWGVEQALFAMHQKRSRTSIPLESAGLLFSAKDIAGLQLLLKQGARTVKVKLATSGLGLNEEIQGLGELGRIAEGQISFRFDANRSFSVDDVLRLTDDLGNTPVKVDYLEEPLADWRDLHALKKQVPWPIALDESLWGHDGEAAAALAGVLILKPTRLGGLRATRRWIERGRDMGARVVLSSCYDTGVTMATYLDLMEQYALHSQNTAMGFGPYAFFPHDLLVRPLAIGMGHGSVTWHRTTASEINRSLLKEVGTYGASHGSAVL